MMIEFACGNKQLKAADIKIEILVLVESLE